MVSAAGYQQHVRIKGLYENIGNMTTSWIKNKVFSAVTKMNDLPEDSVVVAFDAEVPMSLIEIKESK